MCPWLSALAAGPVPGSLERLLLAGRDTQCGLLHFQSIRIQIYQANHTACVPRPRALPPRPAVQGGLCGKVPQGNSLSPLEPPSPQEGLAFSHRLPAGWLACLGPLRSHSSGPA